MRFMIIIIVICSIAQIQRVSAFCIKVCVCINKIPFVIRELRSKNDDIVHI